MATSSEKYKFITLLHLCIYSHAAEKVKTK